jgi:hypothetical protein
MFKLSKMQNQKEISVRTGKAEKPVSNYLSDVLNFVDRADIRHVQIIMNACGNRCEAYLSRQPWVARGNRIMRETSKRRAS